LPALAPDELAPERVHQRGPYPAVTGGWPRRRSGPAGAEPRPRALVRWPSCCTRIAYESSRRCPQFLLGGVAGSNPSLPTTILNSKPGHATWSFFARRWERVSG